MLLWLGYSADLRLGNLRHGNQAGHGGALGV